MGFLDSLFGNGKATQKSEKILAPEDNLEKLGGSITSEQLKQLQGLVGAGANQSDVANYVSSQRDLAALLKQFSQNGANPTQQDLASAQSFTNSVFAPQQESMRQGFSDQLTQSNRDAAMLGRDINDPILRAKLAQSQGREQSMLDAQKTSMFAQQAQQAPLQRLGFANDLSNVYSSLSNQAFSNRQALLSLGNTVQQQGRAFRSGNATTVGTQTKPSKGLLSAIGGVAGAVGGLGTIGTGIGTLASLMGSFGGTQGAPMQAQPKVNGAMQPGDW